MTAGHQQERLSIAEQEKWFLAGFIEGEGSVSVSFKEHPSARFGLYLDPEFYLYQIRDYPQMLERARKIFATGRIFPRPGNEKVLVFAITSRRSLAEKVVPFLRKYMTFSPRRHIYETFCEIVEAMERKEHHTVDGLKRIVQMAYSLNPTANGKAQKPPLPEVMDRILRDHTRDPER
jgi:hypothetical protein